MVDSHARPIRGHPIGDGCGSVVCAHELRSARLAEVREVGVHGALQRDVPLGRKGQDPRHGDNSAATTWNDAAHDDSAQSVGAAAQAAAEASAGEEGLRIMLLGNKQFMVRHHEY